MKLYTYLILSALTVIATPVLAQQPLLSVTVHATRQETEGRLPCTSILIYPSKSRPDAPASEFMKYDSDGNLVIPDVDNGPPKGLPTWDGKCDNSGTSKIGNLPPGSYWFIANWQSPQGNTRAVKIVQIDSTSNNFIELSDDKN